MQIKYSGFLLLSGYKIFAPEYPLRRVLIKNKRDDYEQV